MTENNNTFVWEEPLASDVWAGGAAKSFGDSFATPEEELEAWRQGVAVLEGFCQVADALQSEPLILATVDAKVRAEEELERARDRAERPEGVELTEREDERILALMHRADALGNACIAMEDWSAEPEYVARYLPILTEMRNEAHDAYLRYRREIGLPE